MAMRPLGPLNTSLTCADFAANAAHRRRRVDHNRGARFGPDSQVDGSVAGVVEPAVGVLFENGLQLMVTREVSLGCRAKHAVEKPRCVTAAVAGTRRRSLDASFFR
jgi:hypothetical protein